jgi:diaminopropionate ammonia-lyase
MRDLADIGVVAGETGAAGLAGLRAAVAAPALDLQARRVLVLCTEGATDPAAYRRIVGREP